MGGGEMGGGGMGGGGMGPLGGGGFFGGSGGSVGPRGPYGAWPSLGCSSFFIIMAGMLMVCGGCLRMFGQ